MSVALKLFKRWLRFNSVGAAGIAVQLTSLWLLATVLNINYWIATSLAVEAAVLHNFVWHELWTWGDRKAATRVLLAERLIHFHLANGLVSIAGNIILTRTVMLSLQLPILPANAVAIAACSMINFGLGHCLVFKSPNQPIQFFATGEHRDSFN